MRRISTSWAVPILMLLLLAAIAACSEGPISETVPTSTNPTVTTTGAPPTSQPTPTTTPGSTTSTTESLVTTSLGLSDHARFEPGECEVRLPGQRAHCGHLVVPEDRNVRNGSMVRLPVIVFEAVGDDPLPDPVIYLAGGGGIDQLGMMEVYREIITQVVTGGRDFIMYNQRGSPRTEPEIECPGLEALHWELAGQRLSINERNRRIATFWASCRSGLEGRTIDPNLYSTAANAADANDLREALGYEQANYYGTSYGTRIGFALLRDHPEGVRSIILDSAYPPEADYYTSYPANVARAIESLFVECDARPACSGLEQAFFDTVERLDAQPTTITYPEGDVIVDGMMFIDVIWALVQSTGGRAAAPSFIEDAAEGVFSQFEPVFPALFDYPGSLGAYYAFQCREEVPKHRFDDVVSAAEGIPQPISDYGVWWFAALDYTVCEAWGVPSGGPAEWAPVTSDVPALVLAGEFDPITPSEWGRSAAEGLSNGWFFEMTGHSHGVMRSSGCARQIALEFIDAPLIRPAPGCYEAAS